MRVTLIEATLGDTFSYARRMLLELATLGHATSAGNGAAVPDEGPILIDGPALGGLVNASDAVLARSIALVHQPEALTGASLLPSMRAVIVTGAPAAALLTREHGAAPERLHVIAPGTDARPRTVGSGAATCHILAGGALTPRKGHDVLLAALGRLPDLDWRLTIAGARRDPAFADALAAQAGTLGITERVTFAPRVDEALWATADVATLASRWESFPSFAAEALARGIPLAVTDDGATAGLVPSDAAAIVKPGDDVQLGKAMRRMIFDIAARAAMAEAAWQAGQNLPGWPTQARLLERVLT